MRRLPNPHKVKFYLGKMQNRNFHREAYLTELVNERTKQLRVIIACLYLVVCEENLIDIDIICKKVEEFDFFQDDIAFDEFKNSICIWLDEIEEDVR